MSFVLNWKTYIKIYIISIIIAILLREPINTMVLKSTISIYEMTGIYFSPFFIIFIFLYFVVVMIPITLLHELLHGATYMLFGGRFKIGFKGIYAFCQETSGIQLTKTQFLMVLLTPVMVISMISILLSYKWGLMAFVLNLLGSSGDLYMALWLCKVDKNKRIIDKSYGFDVI